MLTVEDPVYQDLLADVAAMYYLEHMTQVEIGEALGLSRVKVHRLLKEARDADVVHITIRRSHARRFELERRLKNQFGLSEALVLDTAGLDEVGIWRSMGEITARYLERLLTPNATIAICLGRSTYQVVQAIRPGLDLHVRVAQASGSIPFAVQEHDSSTVARQLADKLGGKVLYLPSPMVADSAEGATVLRRQRDIERTLAAARKAGLALVGIGNLDDVRVRLIDAVGLSPEQFGSLKQAGAVGDIAGQMFTSSGQPCWQELAARTIGLTLEDLQHIRTVIAVAFGASKALAILGALGTGAIDVLSTDSGAAGEVLRLAEAAR